VPRPPASLPTALRDRAFTLGDGRAAGLTRARMRASDLEAPTSSVRLPAGAAPTLARRAHAFALVLPPDTAFSHLTAAHLLGLPTPRPWVPAEPLDVMRPTDRPRLKRRGVRSHRGLETRHLLAVDGLRVTDPLDTWTDLADTLTTTDLVVVGDALLGPSWRLRPKDLERQADDQSGRGVRRLRRAADLVRVGSASPWESRARVRFHEWGLPAPELNVDLYAACGRWLARPDFVWREQRVVGEYDGDQHRTDRSAWQYERERRAGLEDEGWSYVEMTSLSLVGARESSALRTRLTRLLVP